VRCEEKQEEISLPTLAESHSGQSKPVELSNDIFKWKILLKTGREHTFEFSRNWNNSF